MMRPFLQAMLCAAMLVLPALAPARANDPTLPEAPAVPVIRQSHPVLDDPLPAKAKKPKPVADTAAEEVALATLKPPSHRCFVRDVMAFYDRTHVRCYNRAAGKFSFFAVDTGQPVAETVLLKAWRAMRSGKPLTITYAPTADLNPTNCAGTDCRRLLDVLN